MGIFDILTLIGGLCLFLFGMNVMGDGLERRAGGGLKLLLGKLTNNRMKGFLTGLGVTAVFKAHQQQRLWSLASLTRDS